MKGKTLKERAKALIMIAHPDVRDELYEAYELRFNEPMNDIFFHGDGKARRAQGLKAEDTKAQATEAAEAKKKAEAGKAKGAKAEAEDQGLKEEAVKAAAEKKA